MLERSRLALLALVVVLIVGAPARAEETNTAPDQPPVMATLDADAARAVAEFYAYDATIPLEARIVEQKERDGALRQKIVFRGVQGFLVPGYLELPVRQEGPYPCVLLLHGWSGSKESWWQDGNYISGGNVRRALLEAGCAVFALDAQCHGDRTSQNDFAPVNHYEDKNSGAPPRKGYFTLPEIYIQTTRDYRRAIDYLATRDDIDAERIGVVGYSMGGTQTYLLTGVEPRIKSAVAVAAPAERSHWSPVAPQNFIRAIGRRPFLSIMGRNDPMCPVEHAEARHSLLDSDPKKQVFLDAGHRLPVDYVPHTVAWIKQHL